MENQKLNFETKPIKIDQLVTENLQTRAEMREECIEDYALTYRETPEKMPPVTVYYDSMLDKYYLADGFHRVAACKLNGCDTIPAKVFEGDYRDALKFALVANEDNGERRSAADKMHAMEIAWANWRLLLGNERPKGQTNGVDNGLPSKRQLAKITNVSNEWARIFINKLGGGNSGHPTSGKHADELTVPTLSDETPDALTVTKGHLEERDPSVRARLKDHKDRFDLPIPERLEPAFLSREPQVLVRSLKALYSQLEKRRLEGDVVFLPFVALAMTHLDNLINTIRHGTVYCVCRMCRGEGCGSCNNLGFQTRAQYERNPSEFKAEIQ